MRSVVPAKRRMVGWLLVLAGLLLVVDEFREFLRYLVLIDDSTWFGYLPELAFALALILIGAWFVTSPLVRIALCAVALGLLIHAFTGVFVHDTGTADVLFVTYHSLSVIGCLASGVLMLTRKVFAPAANVLFAIGMFLLVLVGVGDLASVAFSELAGFPFASLDGPGDYFQLPNLLRNWLFLAIEILAGILQIATGIAVTRPSTAATQVRS